MDELHSSTLLSIIQLAITPVILISGIGAFMITLTNRMARIVDRTRTLAAQVWQVQGEDRQHLVGQLAILWTRSKLIRRAVTCAGLTMLVACCLVIVIFISALLEKDLAVLMLMLFMASVLMLISALFLFLRDIYLSLRVLHQEVRRSLPDSTAPFI
ncbi:hypothetical protein AXK11_06730 [Cephaloticoccus primus]|uniref:II family cellulose-binding protein n=1 Tax=Cephaloticoccus primus TaxID=1548207 RepID=A0A139SLB2_9BACT|nr:DUF2721 domain-containing protein [Cephaloticoccus primus]KXU35343.1 hypothetical protein AXK11_06730 [Cephaloticoccus primus]